MEGSSGVGFERIVGDRKTIEKEGKRSIEPLNTKLFQLIHFIESLVKESLHVLARQKM